MSQEKIDRYKEEKANRKKNLSKKKRNAVIGKVAGVIVGLAIVVWIGFSGYKTFFADDKNETVSLSDAEYQSLIDALNASTTTTGVNLERDPSTTGEGATDESKSSEESTTPIEDKSSEE